MSSPMLSSFCAHLAGFVPVLLICLALLLLNVVFLLLLTRKPEQVQSFRKKVLLGFFKGQLLYRFLQELITDWRTWRNTKINSSKMLPLPPLPELKARKSSGKCRKTVSFTDQNNEEHLYNPEEPAGSHELPTKCSHIIE